MQLRPRSKTLDSSAKKSQKVIGLNRKLINTQRKQRKAKWEQAFERFAKASAVDTVSYNLDDLDHISEFDYIKTEPKAKQGSDVSKRGKGEFPIISDTENREMICIDLTDVPSTWDKLMELNEREKDKKERQSEITPKMSPHRRKKREKRQCESETAAYKRKNLYTNATPSICEAKSMKQLDDDNLSSSDEFKVPNQNDTKRVRKRKMTDILETTPKRKNHVTPTFDFDLRQKQYETKVRAVSQLANKLGKSLNASSNIKKFRSGFTQKWNALKASNTCRENLKSLRNGEKLKKIDSRFNAGIHNDYTLEGDGNSNVNCASTTKKIYNDTVVLEKNTTLNLSNSKSNESSVSAEFNGNVFTIDIDKLNELRAKSHENLQLNKSSFYQANGNQTYSVGPSDNSIYHVQEIRKIHDKTRNKPQKLIDLTENDSQSLADSLDKLVDIPRDHTFESHHVSHSVKNGLRTNRSKSFAESNPSKKWIHPVVAQNNTTYEIDYENRTNSKSFAKRNETVNVSTTNPVIVLENGDVFEIDPNKLRTLRKCQESRTSGFFDETGATQIMTHRDSYLADKLNKTSLHEPVRTLRKHRSNVNEYTDLRQEKVTSRRFLDGELNQTYIADKCMAHVDVCEQTYDLGTSIYQNEWSVEANISNWISTGYPIM